MSSFWKRIPRRAWLRVALWALVIAAGILTVRATPLGELLTEERMSELLQGLRRAWWAPVVLVALYVVLSPLALPMMPLIVGGAAFGPLRGTLFNTLGLVMGAAVSFLLARLLGREFVTHLAGKRLKKVERFFERRGFWPLVQTRFLPLPFAAVNYGAALAGVRFPLFLGAAVVGLLPSTWIHTYFISELIAERGDERWITGAAYLGAFVAFNVVLSIPSLLRNLRRRQRYREILAHRRRKVAAPSRP